jgi:hypothetical protein
MIEQRQRVVTGEQIPPEARAALALLWKAFAFARDLDLCPWEFSLRLKHLVELGVTESDLQWLVLHGYVDHADERTTFHDPVLRFQPSTNVAFTVETCFVLGETGALVAGPGGEGADLPPSRPSKSPEILSFSSHLPRWDRESHVLYLGQQVVKRYKRPSPNQDIVLSAFEEEGWPGRIYDPLPPKDEVVTKNRLHATIKWLNLNQETRLLRFRGDGTGEGVCWERVDAGTLTISAYAAKELPPAA